MKQTHDKLAQNNSTIKQSTAQHLQYSLPLPLVLNIALKFGIWNIVSIGMISI